MNSAMIAGYVALVENGLDITLVPKRFQEAVKQALKPELKPEPESEVEPNA